MRTTIRLPDDLFTQVRVKAATDGETITAFITAALRAALAGPEQAATRKPYRVVPFAGNGLQPGVDLDDMAALEDLLDSHARP